MATPQQLREEASSAEPHSFDRPGTMVAETRSSSPEIWIR